MSAAATDIGDLLVSTPGFRNGYPCLRGTGITVHNVAARFVNGDSVDTICGDLPSVSRAAVHAALAYYFLHEEEVEADWERDQRWSIEQADALGAPVY